MSYKPGDAQLITIGDHEADFGPIDGTEGEDWFLPSDSRAENTRVKGFPYVELPHSCDSWIIGTAADVRLMIAELQALLARMEQEPQDLVEPGDGLFSFSRSLKAKGNKAFFRLGKGPKKRWSQ